MSEELTPLTHANISNAVKKLYSREKIVSHDLDLSKWKIKHLYKDTLHIQLLDSPDADTIMKGGLFIPLAQSKGAYRIGKVIMCGGDVKYAKEGEFVMFNHGVGQPCLTPHEGYQTFFLREDSVISVVEFEGSAEELQTHMVDDLQLQLPK
jgi:hypothetical protein